jgi:predicted DNA-binding antitoxin AbrB/MazE fold protein
MNLTIDAIYENGVLKPTEPLPLKEREKVQVTIHTPAPDIMRAYGIMGFAGSAEEAEYFALSPDLDPLED